MKKKYTEEETAKFKAERNANTKANRERLKGTLIWNSAKNQQGTFRGSVQKDLIEKEDES